MNGQDRNGLPVNFLNTITNVLFDDNAVELLCFS